MKACTETSAASDRDARQAGFRNVLGRCERAEVELATPLSVVELVSEMEQKLAERNKQLALRPSLPSATGRTMRSGSPISKPAPPAIALRRGSTHTPLRCRSAPA